MKPTRFYTNILMILVIFFTFWSCSEEKFENIDLGCHRIPTGPGPGHMVSGSVPIPRIFVSSHNKRLWKTFGEIYAVDLRDHSSVKMKRKHEPSYLPFRPDGLGLSTNHQKEKILYVALHGEKIPGSDHGIAFYKVTGNLLLFRGYLKDPLLRQPLSIAALPGGKLFVANNSSLGRGFLGLSRKKAGQILFYDGKKWSISADELDHAGSLTYRNGLLAVTQSKSNEVTLFDADPLTGKLTNPRKIGSEIPNPGNISFADDNTILGAAHPSSFSLVQHSRHSDHPSPSLIFEIDIAKKEARTIYLNDGYEISAASGALMYKKTIYISQLFGSYLMNCPAPEKK